MQYRRFGKTDWQVSEMGYGMWGLVGWKDSDDKEIEASLNRAVELGCNFFAANGQITDGGGQNGVAAYPLHSS